MDYCTKLLNYFIKKLLCSFIVRHEISWYFYFLKYLLLYNLRLYNIKIYIDFLNIVKKISSMYINIIKNIFFFIIVNNGSNLKASRGLTTKPLFIFNKIIEISSEKYIFLGIPFSKKGLRGTISLVKQSNPLKLRVSVSQLPTLPGRGPSLFRFLSLSVRAIMVFSRLIILNFPFNFSFHFFVIFPHETDESSSK